MVRFTMYGLLLFVLALSQTACKSLEKSSKSSEDIPTATLEERTLEDVVVAVDQDPAAYERPRYNPSYTRRNDLIHTRLDVKFDWEKQHLLGEASLKISPIFYPVDTVILHAQGFLIHEVAMLDEKGGHTPLRYAYDAQNLKVHLGRTYTRDEEYTLFIKYTARPEEVPQGTGAAISSDKGLYFINPKKENPEVPQQIWTQGEPQSNSRWFPTIDRPNERCTQEMNITVQDKFKTLSNGLLKSSTEATDGMRTDHWVMDKPHAPYLFMMAVGEFAFSEETWNGKPLTYYVEEEYADYAKDIYPYTGEMLTLFSSLFGYEYPWSKYGQIVVREYVSGAMENTTGVIFGDFIQLTKRELIDNHLTNEKIVAHEMVHHWFGDLVTCESWANLPLNEAFANYGEHLWMEHKYGDDAADHHRYEEITGYIGQSRNFIHPLIYFGYEVPLDMFDAHSYNKGGAILHMLRKYLGDEAFFAGLKEYLHTNEYTAVEAHQLRLAFEKVSGEDLNWFFNQWFYAAGHPKLEVTRSYDAETKEAVLTLEQTQSQEEVPVFILPVDVDVYVNGKATRYRAHMTEKIQEFRFPATTTPDWVAVDPERVLLVQRVDDELTPEQQAFSYKHATSFLDRHYALRGLNYQQEKSPVAKSIMREAVQDTFWVLRAQAIRNIKIDAASDQAIIKTLQKLARTDAHPSVRSAAIERLCSLGKGPHLDILNEIFEKEQSYLVLSTSLQKLNEVDSERAFKAANTLKSTKQSNIVVAVGAVYASTGDAKYLNYFEENFFVAKNYSRLLFFNTYTKLLLATKDVDLMTNKMSKLGDIALNQSLGMWGRFASAKGVKSLEDYFKQEEAEDAAVKARQLLEKIKKAETNPTLKRLYGDL